MRKTKENGITLIALIITIIVMLILVGVTVSVSLNGGLFSTTKKAANKTQVEIERETLASAAWGAIGNNGEVDFTVLDITLPSGFEGRNKVYTSGNNNTFIVDKYGNVELADEDLILLRRYFLGDNGTGKNFESLINVEESSDKGIYIFNDDELTIADASTSIQYIYEIDYNFYIKWSGKIYSLTIDDDYLIKDVEFKYELPQGREGEKVKYDSNNDGIEEDWIILYDNGDNVEIISLKNMGELTLGKDDVEAQGENELERAIYSYNNAISRLNNYCASLVTNENKISVRCVGSNRHNPANENSTLYTSETLANLAEGKYNGVGKSEDDNYEEDTIRMALLECIATEDFYWIASRWVSDYNSIVEFYIPYMHTGGYYDVYRSIWNMSESGADLHWFTTYSVRPVVKISSDKI